VRLVVLFQARDVAKDQPGYHDGFLRLMQEGVVTEYHAIPYLSTAKDMGWPGLWTEARRQARAIEADAVFLQFFHEDSVTDPAAGIEGLRSLPSRPVVFSSMGDPFGRWARRIPSTYKTAARLSEVNFSTSMGYLASQLSASGAKNIVLMPNGVCQVRFSAALNRTDYDPIHDVVFVGNSIGARNPFSDFFWNERRRRDFVKQFSKHFGDRFAVYGRNWSGPSARGPIPYSEQHQVFRRSRVVAGGFPYAWCDYYTSDRVLIALASGIPFVDFAVPMVDQLFEDGRDWWLACTTEEMIAQCRRLLEKPDKDRPEIAAKTREMILQAHTQYHRCRQMIEIVREVRTARQTGRPAAMPALPFLRGDPLNEQSPAIVNWLG
jgi:hypothetical protein